VAMFLIRSILFMSLIWYSAFSDDVRVDVVHWDLEKTSGTLLRMDDVQMKVVDDSGSVESILLDEVACVLFRNTLEASEGDSVNFDSTGFLHQVTGGRLTGKPVFDATAFTWKNWWTGASLEDLSVIRSFNMVDSTDFSGLSEVEDVVSLSNQDRLAGFIDSIENGVIALEKTDGTTLRVPLKNVDRVRFANPLKKSSGPSIWSTRGDRFQIESIQFVADSGFTVSGRSMSQNLLNGIVFQGERITPLSVVPVTLHQTKNTPRFHLPKPLIDQRFSPFDASSIELSGPIRAEWRLGQKGLGFVCRVMVPRSALSSADMRIRILDGEIPLTTFILDASSPAEDVSVRLSGNILVIEVLDGGNGPIMDRIRIEEALLITPDS
jgi:hypothetical protein